jgi:pimeloyl-ACP methyl ester carboxylesterase
MDFTTRDVDANGIRIHLVEAGEGPAVLLCHGFPESSHSWRHQLKALAEAGYRAIAPDMRGYGGTDAPEPIEAYSQLSLIGDMVALLDALRLPQAVIAGHDWGAPVAWYAALMRPDRFPAVIGLSVPYIPRGPASAPAILRHMGRNRFYQLYFQEPGVAERDCERDLETTLRRTLWAWSGGPADYWDGEVVPDGFVASLPEPPALPDWFDQADIDAYVQAFARNGFRGPLNWYRNMDRDWGLLAPFHMAHVPVPALFLVGERDPVRAMLSSAILALPHTVPALKASLTVPGAGHWVQQEAPDAVNAAMLDFLRESWPTRAG